MSRRLNEEFSDLGVHSIDGYQGREKEAVVISLVRSNPSGKQIFPLASISTAVSPCYSLYRSGNNVV